MDLPARAEQDAYVPWEVRRVSPLARGAYTRATEKEEYMQWDQVGLCGPCDLCGTWMYSWCEACEAYAECKDEQANVVVSAICTRCNAVPEVCAMCASVGHTWQGARAVYLLQQGRRLTVRVEGLS